MTNDRDVTQRNAMYTMPNASPCFELSQISRLASPHDDVTAHAASASVLLRKEREIFSYPA